MTHTDAPEQARVPPEAVIVVVTVAQPVPKGPWVPEAVLDRRGPSGPEVFPAPRAPQVPEGPKEFRVSLVQPGRLDLLALLEPME